MLTLQERWHTRCQSLRCWVETHSGYLPKKGINLPCGFGIGAWLHNQRKQLQSQRLDGVRIAALDDAAPGWRITIDLSSDSLHKRPSATELELENRFTVNLREATALVAEFGRLPRANGLCAKKTRLASWLSHQRRCASLGKLSIERAQRLDHSLPGWRTDIGSDEMVGQWQDALASLVARVKELGRLPTGPSARWMYEQRRALREGRLCESREIALSEAVPGWKKPSRRRERQERTDACDSTGLPAVRERAGI